MFTNYIRGDRHSDMTMMLSVSMAGASQKQIIVMNA